MFESYAQDSEVTRYLCWRPHQSLDDSVKARNDFHDITVGNNALDSTVGFDATRGYDLATGFGTPDVANLVRDLAVSPFGGNPLFALPALFAGNGSGHGVHEPHVAHTMIPG